MSKSFNKAHDSSQLQEASKSLKSALSAFEAVVVNDKIEQEEKAQKERKCLLIKLRELLKDFS